VIRFGPPGWRGLFADEITVASVRKLAAAAARHLHTGKAAGRGVVVGYDGRFLSPRLAREAAGTLVAAGVPAHLSRAPLPTAVFAHAVTAGRRALGIVLTAGASPAEIGGVLLLGPDGAPADPATLHAIERAAGAPETTERTRAAKPARAGRRTAPKLFDPWPAYLRHLERSARRLGARRGRLKVACDARRGAAAGRFGRTLGSVARAAVLLNDTPHPGFGEGGPDCGEAQLQALARAVRRDALALGLAVDADAGRFGVVDRGGVPVPANLVTALLADWILERGAPPGALARTAATTHLVDDVAARHGRSLVETPVGFAYIAPLLTGRQVAVACEEEGGFTVATHLPMRDGLFAALLVVAMTSARRASLMEQARALFASVGPRHGRRIDYHVDAATRARMIRRLEDPPAALAGRRVTALDAPDGPRLTFENGAWLLVRDAAADQVARCHIETRSRADLEAITTAARELLGRA